VLLFYDVVKAANVRTLSLSDVNWRAVRATEVALTASSLGYEVVLEAFGVTEDTRLGAYPARRIGQHVAPTSGQ
jgi:hypothetical protein